MTKYTSEVTSQIAVDAILQQEVNKSTQDPGNEKSNRVKGAKPNSSDVRDANSSTPQTLSPKGNKPPLGSAARSNPPANDSVTKTPPNANSPSFSLEKLELKEPFLSNNKELDRRTQSILYEKELKAELAKFNGDIKDKVLKRVIIQLIIVCVFVLLPFVALASPVFMGTKESYRQLEQRMKLGDCKNDFDNDELNMARARLESNQQPANVVSNFQTRFFSRAWLSRRSWHLLSVTRECFRFALMVRIPQFFSSYVGNLGLFTKFPTPFSLSQTKCP